MNNTIDSIVQEVRMKCEECEGITFAGSEFETCECGGELFHIALIETV